MHRESCGDDHMPMTRGSASVCTGHKRFICGGGGGCQDLSLSTPHAIAICGAAATSKEQATRSTVGSISNEGL